MKCAECDQTKRIKARGLCAACYEANRRNGTLHRFDRRIREVGERPPPKDRTTWRSRDLIEEIEFLGFDARFPGRPQFRNLAPRLGMTFKAVERAYYRHQQETRSAA